MVAWESPMEEAAFTPIINPWVETSFYNCMTEVRVEAVVAAAREILDQGRR